MTCKWRSPCSYARLVATTAVYACVTWIPSHGCTGAPVFGPSAHKRLARIRDRLEQILKTPSANFEDFGVWWSFTPCARNCQEAAKSAIFGLQQEIRKFCKDTEKDIAESKMGKRAAENRKLEADQLVTKLGEWSKLLGVSLDDLKKSVEDTGVECTAIALGELDL